MLLLLPTELVDQIIDYAVYTPTKITGNLPTSTVSTTLLSLIATCRTLYARLIPILYQTLPIRIAPVPVCIFSPALIQYTTTVLFLPQNQRLHYKEKRTQKRDSLAPLVTALRNFHNLETLHIFNTCPPGLIRAVADHNLTSLTCPGSSLVHCTTPNRWRLRSLSVINCPYAPNAPVLTILTAHAATLEHLGVNFRFRQPRAEMPRLPLLSKIRSLSLVGWNTDLLSAFCAVIRFNELRTLQLVNSELRDLGVAHHIQAAGGLPRLQKMSLHLMILQVCPLLELTRELEELHIVCRIREPRRTADFANVVTRRCKGLKALTWTNPDILWLIPAFTLRAEDLIVIAAGCEGLVDIRVGVVLEEFESVISTLALFPSVRYLHIDLARADVITQDNALMNAPAELRPLGEISERGFGPTSEREEAVDWAFERARSILQGTGLKGLSVMAERNTYIREWVKPGVPVKDICLGEVRSRCRFKTMGRGAWNGAFEPVGYSSEGWAAGSAFDL